MKTLEEIFGQGDIKKTVADLTKKQIAVPAWSDLIKQYEPLQHDIMTNKSKYPDKTILDENNNIVKTEPVTPVCVGLQKLAAKRISEFMFTTPINIVCQDAKTDATVRQQLAAVRSVLKKNKWNTLNKKRCKIISSECEQATYWYVAGVTKETTGTSGTMAKTLRLRYDLWSPSRGDELYPLFDDMGDMVAFSRQYEMGNAEGKKDVYLDTWTADRHYLFKQTDGNWEMTVADNKLGKIPVVYSYRPEPIWADGDNGKVEQIEKLLSRNGDILDYHSSPVLVFKGDLVGAPSKGEANRIFYTSDAQGGAEYISWTQSPESTRFQFETLLRMFWSEMQLPDLSYENVKGIGATSGVALKMLFSDAHLKCGDEWEIYEELIERELNIIKAYLSVVEGDAIKDLEIEPVMRPFIINDERENIEVLVRANGGKPVVSQKQSVALAALSDDTDADYLAIQAEYAAEKKTGKRLSQRIEGV
jgi:hypothetical protein